MEREEENKPDWLVNAWVSVSEAARLLDVSDAYIRNRCKKDNAKPFVWRLNSRKNKEIRLLHLGKKAIKKYREEQL